MNKKLLQMSVLTTLVLLSLASSPETAAPSGWVRVPAGGQPTPTASHAIAYDAEQKTILKFGGIDNQSNVIAETWELNLQTRSWVQLTPPQSPSARYGARMAYYPQQQVTVLFGGLTYDFEYLDDTWLWDGQNWTQAFPAHKPPGRCCHGLVYDSGEQAVVLFGGFGPTNPTIYNDLWEWDGQDWKERPASDRPPGRQAMAFTYDSRRDTLTVFGGASGCCFLNDTWEWSNGIWTQRTPANRPPARAYPIHAYSPGAGYTLIFGGQGADFNFRGDTWLWDGNNWVETAQDRHPLARSGDPGVYVPRLRSIAFFGGLAIDQFTELNDTWAYLDPR